MYFVLACSLLFLSCNGDAKSSESSDNMQQNAVATTNDAPASKMTVEDGKPMVVDFSATWCPPCQALKPVFAKLTKEYEGRITMVTVDVDENNEMAAKFNVQSIPTIIYFDAEGNQVNRTQGLLPEEELRSNLDALLK